MNSLDRRLAALTPDVLRNLRRGIEKESLRVRPDGTLADTPHPAGLGAALTHPHITTDFSDAQLELITGAHASVDACLDRFYKQVKGVRRKDPGHLRPKAAQLLDLRLHEIGKAGRG